MPIVRVAFLWHQHQPFYKDLVTGEYRLPWVRLHALKDYYGMVKLLDEFPHVHQTFNLVPSLISQIQDYVSGKASDPFLQVASKPASELRPQERRFALSYLFQANPVYMIGRYPRYQELWRRFESAGQDPDKAIQFFQIQDFADLQVLSQLAWFDEYFLHDPEVAELIRKGRDFNPQDQQVVLKWQKIILSAVIPAHTQAARQGSIELSTSPYYHPILPLVCDSSQGSVSTPGLPLPQNRFRHPEDAREQLKRGLDLHQQVFGVRPVGVWPSEGSVSEETLAIAAELGVQWMATDEGVLGRTLGISFERSEGRLRPEHAQRLYASYLYRKGKTEMRMFFRDHALSDLIGFVYSGMPAKQAADHFIKNIKLSAKPILDKGIDAVVPIILDGENAWEFYPESGREFLRRVYDAIQSDPAIEAVTMSEGIKAEREPRRLDALVPGSWINANFNVWIGAPEDNKAWDYLADAREFYAREAPKVDAKRAELAFEELLIAEGSDWNWWYGPEHHTANDRDFDELYRKHLSNVYRFLGADVPLSLAQPIAGGTIRPTYAKQTAYIHPRIGTGVIRYFDWLGAAIYSSDRHSGAMHGRLFLLDSIYTGIDEQFLYARIDFAEPARDPVQLVANFELESPHTSAVSPELKQGTKSASKASPTGNGWIRWKLVADLHRRVSHWELRQTAEDAVVASDGAESSHSIEVVLTRTFEFKIPLAFLRAEQGMILHLRFSLWQDGLPIDAMPLEGSIQVPIVSEDELETEIYSVSN
jgi:alpha-amylase/alpha-mannosidase (GH57 family)